MDWEGTISLLFVIKTLYHRTIFCVYAIILIIMAQLCTLEGEYKGLSIDDLFDVNDFLGVKIFGVDNWNKIKS